MLFSDTYKTIEKLAEIIYKDKGSKFLTYIFSVENEIEVKECLLKLKKEHPTANHHCYAYVLGFDKSASRANDDGEPSYTAGKPIMGQIQSHDLTNVLIVVVRYFGGTLLGVSGLISAYKNSALEVIKQTTIIEKHILYSYKINFNFEQLNEVMKLMKVFECKIIHQNFDTLCEISFSVKKSVSNYCEEKLRKIEGLTVQLL